MKKLRTLLLLMITSVSLSYSQNVGIGTTTPAAKLDVNGNVIVRGLSGHTGQYLTVDGIGTLTVGSAPTGPTGPTGTAGSNGTNGTNGSNGSNGATGPTGTAGTNGTNGAVGATGTAGTNGTNGTNGSVGATGPTGLTGTAGTNGTNGTNGAVGATGTAGTNGTNGAVGATGPAPSGTGIVTVSGGVLQTPALLTGDVTSTGIGLSTTLAIVATAGTNTKITYNAKGLVTSGTTLSASDIPSGSGNYIQNQNSSAQSSSNFWISGSGTITSIGTIGQVITTSNNVINTANPKAADIVIGSDAGTRHDGSIMWWSSASASRISNTSDVFYLSVWNTASANIGLAAAVGGSSYFQGNVGIGNGNTSPSSLLHMKGGSVRITGTTNTTAETGGMLIFDNGSGIGGNSTKTSVSRKSVSVTSSNTTEVQTFNDGIITVGAYYSSGVYYIAWGIVSATYAVNWDVNSMGMISNYSGSFYYFDDGINNFGTGFSNRFTPSTGTVYASARITGSTGGGTIYLSEESTTTSPFYVIHYEGVTNSSGGLIITTIVNSYY